MPFLLPNQQRETTEGIGNENVPKIIENINTINLLLKLQSAFC